MIGIAGSMGIILAGKVVVPKLALKLGMIDRVAYKETLESVAKAKSDIILKLWEGLGYYRRARNLLASSKLLVKNLKTDIFLIQKNLTFLLQTL